MPPKPDKSQAGVSRKRQDRMHREQQQTRWIVIGSIAVLVLVIGTILYGILDENYLRWQRAVATVNGERISTNEFRAFTRYYRNNLIQQANRAYQLTNMFRGDPNALQSFGGQLVELAQELDVYRAGNQALSQLIDDRLIRQEAKKRGISISPEELEAAVQEALDYYAGGTPTPTSTTAPLATSTLSATQLALIPPTPTVTPTAAITETAQLTQTATAEPTIIPNPVITQTATPLPTATPYTLEAYQSVYATLIANLGADDIPESVVRHVIESRLIQEKLQEQVIGPVDCVEEQVRAQHILVPEEGLAYSLLERIKQGEDWSKLAAQFSTDESNKDQGGDLGWFSKDQMVPEFAEAAFALNEPGELSQPVQTQFGWHLIRLVGKEVRPLSASACEQLKASKFQEWVDGVRAESTVVIKDFWQEVVPLKPALPADIQDVVNQLGGANQSPFAITTPIP
ncbi:MAG: peptidylprolyl isomerase [Anaerolineae bacterium]|jgi:parvulin-like peptidyl-prolyl isomerase|nr:peptidylprolyl isomerase [Anaerolineae bacterium]MCZ7553354.1 peptidylprolyl isomerase [Anaerolineales bacterium]